MGDYSMLYYPFVRLFDVFSAVLAFAFSFGLAVILALIIVFLAQRLMLAVRGTTNAVEDTPRRIN